MEPPKSDSRLLQGQESLKGLAWSRLSAEYMVGVAVTLVSRTVSPSSTQFNSIPSPRSGCPGLWPKQRKH